MNYILEYWNKIQSGELIICNRIRQQYQRLIDDINNPRDPWVFDKDLGLDVIDFIEMFCKHSKGKWAGKNLELELFQKSEIQAKYGFVHKETGFRRFRESFKVVGRKNGKSTEKAAEGLYHLMGDGEPGAEVYCTATKKDQARIVFTEMCNMHEQSKTLKSHIRKRKSDLYHHQSFSIAQPLASDSNSLDGFNTSYCIMDEIHAWKTREVYDLMVQSVAARDQPIVDIITTAGFVRESIFDSQYEYACNILDGIIENDRFLAFIYELDEKDEIYDESMWIKANPGLGTIKPIQYLRDNVEKAKADSSFMPTVLTKDFNIKETVAGSWLSFEVINNPATYDLESLRGCYSVGGVDLSSTTDLTATVQLMMKPNDLTVYCLPMFFIPEMILKEKVEKDKVPYDIWAKRGLVTICNGARVDYSAVTKWFADLVENFDIRPLWIGYDPWNSQYWIEEMQNYGFNMEIIRQGAQTLSQPAKQLAADLAENKVNYNNNPILKWCLTNTAMEYDKNDNIRPTKRGTSRLRIDGTVATINAYVVLLNHLQDYMNMI